MSKNKVAMQEIADKLNISKGSVFKAMAGRDDISDKLRDKIFKTAIKLGYKIEDPLFKVCKKIYYVIHKKYVFSTEQFYSKIFKNLSKLFGSIDIVLVKYIIDDSTTTDDLASLRDEKKIGVVIAGTTNPNVINFFNSCCIPFVSIDNYVGNGGGAYLYIDDYHSSYIITKHLIQKGHKSIHFFVELDSPTNIDKYFGYKKALMENNLSETLCIHHDIDLSKMSSFKSFDFPTNLPSSFLFSSDHAAANFMMLAINNGYSIPEDFSIASFDNTDICEETNPKITSVGPDYEDLSKLCYESLLDRFTKKESAFDLRILSSSIIQRDTVKERK